MQNKISRRGIIAAILAIAPATITNAQIKPPSKKVTPTPPTITPLGESDYRAKIASALLAIVPSFEKIHTRTLEVIRTPAVTTQNKWIKDYLANAVASSDAAAKMFTYDPPKDYALSHVYLLRYCDLVRECIQTSNRAIDNGDTDEFIRSLDLYKSAGEELLKAASLSPK